MKAKFFCEIFCDVSNRELVKDIENFARDIDGKIIPPTELTKIQKALKKTNKIPESIVIELSDTFNFEAQKEMIYEFVKNKKISMVFDAKR